MNAILQADAKLTLTANSGPRIIALDALRQIAALIVLVQHFFVIFEVKAPFWLITGLLDMRGAVTLFFVLSGYVLALSIRKEPFSLISYLHFGIRRVLRIYPMHIMATLLALLVLVWVKDQGGFQNDQQMTAGFLQSDGLELRQWLLQMSLVLPGMKAGFANPPVWTLMTEAKVAIIFPFLAWILLRSSPWIAFGLVAFLVLGSDWFDRNLVRTVSLLGHFAIGCLIARLPSDALASFNRWHWSLWVLFSLTLYAAVSLRYITPNIWIAYYLCSFGSAGLIIATLRYKWLNAKLNQLQRLFRADISYGLYILHYPIMVWLRILSGETVNLLTGPILFLTSLLTTVGLSVILMHLVERPAIRLGKRLTF